jgi:site-specific DNA recombinase
LTVMAGIYARISQDRKSGAGVARQLADCRALAADRGWTVAEEFVDNDLSAFRGKRRPEWERLLAAVADRRISVVVAYHPDRLYRRLADLAGFVDVVKGAGAEVATVRAGDIDLASASGRMIAGMLGSAAVYESERIGERVSRAKKERAAQGSPSGGGMVPFGWMPDRVTQNPRQAKALKVAAGNVAAGGSVTAEARRLNAAGFLTSGGRPWDSRSLLRVLKAARIAGLREYQGKVVGPASWPPIIDEETWHRIQVMVDGRRSPSRIQRQPSLLSGLIACPHCEGPMYLHGAGSRWPTYHCQSTTRGGCGRSAVMQHRADARIEREVEAWLATPGVLAAVEPPARVDISGELDAIKAKRRDLTERWTDGRLEDGDYDDMMARLSARLDDLATPPPRTSVLDPELVRSAWLSGSMEDRRSLLAALFEMPLGLRPERMSDPGERLILTRRHI